MSAKKWLCAFVATVLSLVLLLGAFNYVVDPFGIFGDNFFNWYDYNITQNPRSAKIAYLDSNHDKYDSYIIGCSSTSSYPTRTLNEYFGASFYNMIMYGADMYDVECESRYILENYDCKNLVVNVYIDNALHYGDESDAMTYSQHVKSEGGNPLEYYLRYLLAKPTYSIDKLVSLSKDSYMKDSFDAFDHTDGAYDKRTRDVERIADLKSYLETYPFFENYNTYSPYMTRINETVESIRRIKELCEAKGVNMVVVCAPVYAEYFLSFNPADVTAFYSALAQVTDFWDFSMSSVSYEMRYFYDETHFRNCVGDMALARMFGDVAAYYPEDFGTLVTEENILSHIENIYKSEPLEETEMSAVVPVLLYHSISPEGGDNGMTVTPETFEAQMAALDAAGYRAVSIDQVQRYVERGTPLPRYPILITFDDGYLDNLTYALPILEKYNMRATVFVIGSSIGSDEYKDTGVAITPHFDEEQMKELTDSGLISIQSHTYDMHQIDSYEDGTARDSMLPLEGESEADYVEALNTDIRKSRLQIEAVTSKTVDALAYPKGRYNSLAATVLAENGIQVTFTTESGSNTILKGVPQSLYGMHRYTVYEGSSPEFLAQLLVDARG